MLFTAVWWKYAGARAARTALGMMLPFVGLLVTDGDPVPMLMAAAFGAITSLASSLRGLREVKGENIPKWQAIITRCAWSLGQGIITGFGTAAILPEVDWSAVWLAAASGVATSLVLGLISALPETSDVVTEMPENGIFDDEGNEGAVVVPPDTDVFEDGDYPTRAERHWGKK